MAGRRSYKSAKTHTCSRRTKRRRRGQKPQEQSNSLVCRFASTQNRAAKLN